MTEHTAEQPHAEQVGESPDGAPAQAETPAMNPEAIAEMVNRAVTSQLKRFERQMGDKFASLSATPEPAKPEQPDGATTAKGKAGEVEALRQRLQAIEAERSSEREQSAQQSRDLALRQAIEATGTHRVEHMFRYLKGDAALNVGEDGAYFATDQHGGHLDLGEWARTAYQADAAWRPASGRGGGGGAPQGGGASATSSTAMSRADYRAKLGELIRSGDQNAAQDFQRKVLSGEVEVQK
jgi:hypothetical protein